MEDQRRPRLNAMGEGKTLESAVQKSYSHAGNIQWKNMQFRRDIGKQFYARK